MNRFFWRLVLGCFCSAVVWVIWQGPVDPPGQAVAYWLLRLLDFPIALVWLPFQQAYVLDLWFGNMAEYDFPEAFYYHMKSGVIAYMVFFYLLDISAGMAKLLLGTWLRNRISAPATERPRARRTRVLPLTKLCLAAASLSLGIWCLHAQPLANNIYRIAAAVASVLDWPIALAVQVWPKDLRGPAFLFSSASDPWLSPIQFYARLLGGTAVYLAVFYLVSLVLEQTGLAERISVSGRAIESALATLVVQSRPCLGRLGLSFLSACALAGTVFFLRDLPPGLPSGAAISWVATLLDLPVVLFWSVFAFARASPEAFPAPYYFHMYLGISAYMALFGLWWLCRAIGKRSFEVCLPRRSQQEGVSASHLVRLGLGAYALAITIWYIATFPIPSHTYWLLLDLLAWIEFPVTMVARGFRWELGGFLPGQGLVHRARVGNELVLQHIVLATIVYSLIFVLADGLWRRIRAAGLMPPDSPTSGPR